MIRFHLTFFAIRCYICYVSLQSRSFGNVNWNYSLQSLARISDPQIILACYLQGFGIFRPRCQAAKVVFNDVRHNWIPLPKGCVCGPGFHQFQNKPSLQKVNSISVWMAEGGLNEFCKCPLPWQRDAPHYKALPLELGSKTSGRVFNWLFNCSSANAIHLYSFCNLQIVDCPAGPMKCHMKQYQN